MGQFPEFSFLALKGFFFPKTTSVVVPVGLSQRSSDTLSLGSVVVVEEGLKVG